MNSFIRRLYTLAGIKVPKDKGLDDKIYPYQMEPNQDINTKFSARDLVTYIAKCTKGLQDVKPETLQKSLQGKNAEEIAKTITKLIDDGKQHNVVMVYNPWEPLRKWQTFPQSTLIKLSEKTNIRASALWGIYNSSKKEFPIYIDIVKQYMDKTGGPMPDTVDYNILQTNFKLGFQNIIEQLNTTKGKFYKKLILGLKDNNFDVHNTIREIIISRKKAYENILNQTFTLHGQQHDIHTISQATGVDIDDLILFIVLDNHCDTTLKYDHFITQATIVMGSGSDTVKSENGQDMKVFPINGKQMTYYDIMAALNISRATVYKYLHDQGDNFPKYIEDLINQIIPKTQLKIQVGNKLLYLSKISELFAQQGKQVSRRTLADRFNEIFSDCKFNYKKALNKFTKLINEELNSDKFTLNKVYNSGAIKVGQETKTTNEWVTFINNKWGKELITAQQIRSWKSYLKDDQKLADRLKDIIDNGEKAKVLQPKFQITVNGEALTATQWAERINERHGAWTVRPHTIRSWYTTGIELNQPNFAAEKVQERLLFGSIEKNTYNVLNKDFTLSELASKLSIDKQILVNKWKELQGDYLRMESWLAYQFETQNITANSRLKRKLYAIR